MYILYFLQSFYAQPCQYHVHMSGLAVALEELLTLIPFVSPATILVAGSSCFKVIAVFGTSLVVVNSVMGVRAKLG